MDNKSLAHTKWECKYHLVFAPKYRRQVICLVPSAKVYNNIINCFAFFKQSPQVPVFLKSVSDNLGFAYLPCAINQQRLFSGSYPINNWFFNFYIQRTFNPQCI